MDNREMKAAFFKSFILKLLFHPLISPQTMLTAISMSAIATNGVVPGRMHWFFVSIEWIRKQSCMMLI